MMVMLILTIIFLFLTLLVTINKLVTIDFKSGGGLSVLLVYYL